MNLPPYLLRFMIAAAQVSEALPSSKTATNGLSGMSKLAGLPSQSRRSVSRTDSNPSARSQSMWLTNVEYRTSTAAGVW